MSDDYNNAENGILPVDFTRHRVARLLRRERPRLEQGTAHSRMIQEGLRMAKECGPGYGYDGFELGRIQYHCYNAFGKATARDVIWSNRREAVPASWLRPANSTSQFFNTSSRFTMMPSISSHFFGPAADRPASPDREIKPQDAARARVAEILKREKPRHEQGYNARREFKRKYALMWKAAAKGEAKYGQFRLGAREIRSFNLFGTVDTYRVIWFDTKWGIILKMRLSGCMKPANANWYHKRATAWWYHRPQRL